MVDYYRSLGVSHTASGEEIRKAFRRLARQFHPDLARDKWAAEEKFREIHEAYEILSDPDSRKRYDRGERPSHRSPGAVSRDDTMSKAASRAAPVNDPFQPNSDRTEFRTFADQVLGRRRDQRSDFFRSNGSPSRSGRERSESRRPHTQGAHEIECDVCLSLEEMRFGSVRTISVLRSGPGGGVWARHYLRVRIPPGTAPGQVLRVLGRGATGVGGDAPGELFLRISLRPHPTFQVRGSDLICQLEVTRWEAFAGAEKSIPTLEGPYCVRIRAGTLSGHRLRLLGRGLSKGDGTRGDLVAVIAVKGHWAELFTKRLILASLALTDLVACR